jgi:hypothetical protein
MLFFMAAFPGYLLVVFLYGLLVPEKILNANLSSKRTTTGMLAERLHEAQPFGEVDVLVIGSSHAYRGFDPRHFSANGLRMFNLGSSAQTPSQSKALLHDFLPALKPKLVVFEVFPLSFALDGVESSLDLISHGMNNADLLKTALHQNNMKVYNTLAFFSLSDFFGIEPRSKKADKLDTYIAGGYVERQIQFNAPVKKLPEKWAIDGHQLAEFNACLELIKSYGSEILLVYAPVNSTFYNAYSNQKEVEDALCSGYSYHDFNKTLQLNDTLDFYDAHHLNQVGVDKFNKALLPLILQKIRSEDRN